MEKTGTEKWPYNIPLWRRKFIGQSFSPLITVLQFCSRLDGTGFLWFFTAFFIGRASLLGEVAPFALVFWALVLRLRPERKLPVTLAVLAGWLMINVSVFPPWSVPASMLLWKSLDFVSKRLFKYELHLALLLPLTLIVLRAPYFIWHHFTVYELAIALMEISLAALLPVLLQPLFQLPGSGEKIKGRPSPEVIVAAFLLLGLVFLGMNEALLTGRGALMNMTSFFLVLAGSYLWGPLWGVVAGLGIGLCASIARPELLVYAGVLGAAGLTAGLLRHQRRIIIAGVYLAFLRFMSFFGLEGGYELTGLWEEVAVVALFLIVPLFFWDRLRGLIRYWPFKLEEDEQIRFAMAVRIKDFASVFKELAATFQPAGQEELVQARRDLSPLVDYFSRRVCRACEHFQRCWKNDLNNQYRRVLSMFSNLQEAGAFSERMIPVKLRRYCPRQQEIVKSMGNMQEIYRLNCYWQEKIQDGRELVSQQLQGISAVMHDLAQELKLQPEDSVAQGEETEPESIRFSIEAGIAQVARHGFSVSGDSYALLPLKEGRQAVMLSDGMGSGKEARQASRATVKLMEHLLRAGFRREMVINTINTLLRLRYPAERFATLDLALLDLQAGEVDLYKLGAPPSFLKKGDRVKVIGSGAPPIGILDDITAEKKHFTIAEGGILVMVTDGVIGREPEDGEESFVELLRDIRHDHPQIIADRLIEAACRRRAEPARDDLTALVIRLRKINSANLP